MCKFVIAVTKENKQFFFCLEGNRTGFTKYFQATLFFDSIESAKQFWYSLSKQDRLDKLHELKVKEGFQQVPLFIEIRGLEFITKFEIPISGEDIC